PLGPARGRPGDPAQSQPAGPFVYHLRRPQHPRTGRKPGSGPGGHAAVGVGGGIDPVAKKATTAERHAAAKSVEPAEGQVMIVGRPSSEMRLGGSGLVARAVDADVLEKNLDAFLKTMAQVIGKVQGQLNNYRLESIALKAEV